MGPREFPGIDLPEDWLDAEYSDNPDMRRFQEFVGHKVKEDVLRKHLLAEGIGKPGEVEIDSINIRSYGRRCVIEAWLKVTGQAWKTKDDTTGLYVENIKPEKTKTGKVKLTRSIEKNEEGNIHSASFGTMGVGIAKLPWPFADEYYKRAITLLREIGVKPLATIATTTADNPESEEGRFLGAYVWCWYGYTNHNMDGIRKDFINYLQDDRKVDLTIAEKAQVNALPRMKDLAGHKIVRNGKKLKVGKDFLSGDDGTGRYTRDVAWEGIIADINKDDSQEMEELARYIAKPKRK